MKTTVTCPNWKECRSHRLVVKLSQNCRWNWIDEHLLIHHQINVDYSQWQTFTIALSITLKFHNARKIEQTTKHHWLGCIMPIQQRNSIFVFYSTFQEHTVSKYQIFSLCMFFSILLTSKRKTYRIRIARFMQIFDHTSPNYSHLCIQN